MGTAPKTLLRTSCPRPSGIRAPDRLARPAYLNIKTRGLVAPSRGLKSSDQKLASFKSEPDSDEEPEGSSRVKGSV